MSTSFTVSGSTTFTITHARHLVAKVAADLKRLQRYYGAQHLSDQSIAAYESEAVELMRQGYLKCVTYGFLRNDQWVPPTLRYSAEDLAEHGLDDDPGRVEAGRDIAGARFYSYLEYSPSWLALSPEQRERISAGLAVQRASVPQKTVHNGYFADDKTYSSGGRALRRASVRSFT